VFSEPSAYLLVTTLANSLSTLIGGGTVTELVGALVELIWEDAQFWASEVEPETLSDESIMSTFGRIVRDTDKSLYIASETQTEPETATRAVTRVPWGMVLDVRILADVTKEAPPRPARYEYVTPSPEPDDPPRQGIPGIWHDSTCPCGAGLA